MRRMQIETRDPLAQKLVSLLLAELPEGGEATVLLDAALMERMPEFKGCKVILFTASADPQYLPAAKAAGADGLWYLQPSGAGLEEAVLGKKPFPEKAPPVRLGQICADELTSREMAVLRQVTLGLDLGALTLIFQYLAPGLVFAWVYERAGNIWPSVLLHALVNALAFFVIIV